MALVVTAIIGLGIIPTQAAEKKAEPKKQTTCPVMGGKINKAQYADVKGKRIYVCCPGCIGKIEAAPDKYIKELEDKGIVLDETPKNSKNASKKTSHSHGGHQH
jgi:YHS domain-containing protein